MSGESIDIAKVIVKQESPQDIKRVYNKSKGTKQSKTGKQMANGGICFLINLFSLISECDLLLKYNLSVLSIVVVDFLVQKHNVVA